MSRKNRRRKLIQRRSVLQHMEARLPLASEAGHNFLLPCDVNDDHSVSAGDALAIINKLAEQRHDGRGAPRSEAIDASFATMYHDVNDDGLASASDALRVINELAREGESHNAVEWLAGESGARAKIELERGETGRAELQLRLAGAPADQSFDLIVGDVVLGQVQTDGLGRGKLELKYGGSHPAIPEVLATANRSTTVLIGDIIAGTFGDIGEIEGQDGRTDGGTDGGADGNTDGSSDAMSDGSSRAMSDGAPMQCPTGAPMQCPTRASDSSSDGDSDGRQT